MAVTKTNNLRRGMKNSDDVRQLQTYLNQHGYNLAVDGSFGPATETAVRDYQSKNGLEEDGIVGTNTWGVLTGGNKTTTTPNTNTTTSKPTTTVPDYSKYTYDTSTNDGYLKAMAALTAASENLPTYAGTYDQQVLDIYNKIMNKEDFSYDVNSDALYQQYKDQYKTLGNLAMMDTMGQAAAMNGGYGSSYAQSVGQQAYQGYLQQLNDVVPELYQMAYGQYENEVQDMYNQYDMVSGLAKDEYNKYQDDLDQYWKKVTHLKDVADDEYARGFENWYTSVTLGNEADETAYKRQQDAYNNLVSVITASGYTPTAEELKAAGMTAEQAAAYKTYYTNSLVVEGSGKGSGSGNGNGNGDKPANQTITTKANNGSVSDANIRAMQTKLGFTGKDVDGKWGPKTQAKALEMWGTTSADEAYTKWQAEGGGGKEPTPTELYNEAYEYLKDNIGSAAASKLMDVSRWNAAKEQGNPDAYGATYADYVDLFLEKNQKSKTAKNEGPPKNPKTNNGTKEFFATTTAASSTTTRG